MREFGINQAGRATLGCEAVSEMLRCRHTLAKYIYNSNLASLASFGQPYLFRCCCISWLLCSLLSITGLLLFSSSSCCLCILCRFSLFCCFSCCCFCLGFALCCELSLLLLVFCTLYFSLFFNALAVSCSSKCRKGMMVNRRSGQY